jgi:hypothetical protein
MEQHRAFVQRLSEAARKKHKSRSQSYDRELQRKNCKIYNEPSSLVRF